MDAAGIDVSVLSLVSPGVQGIPDVDEAVTWSRGANDAIAASIEGAARLRTFACVPMQDPLAAAQELRRCVEELGMVGAMVHSYSQVGTADNIVYYDGREYWPFWEEVERLGVPIYLHPRSLPPAQSGMLEGHPWLATAAWGFAVDTTTHALRLMGSGLFDDFPGTQIILGHLGEMLPFTLWRTDHRMRVEAPNCPAKRPFSDYFRENFHVTTSAMMTAPRLADLLEFVGPKRILFATDYPYESMEDTSTWFDALELAPHVRAQIEHENAVRLLSLSDLTAAGAAVESEVTK
jgi:2,3-dihydroxybenzoate decarboxylase